MAAAFITSVPVEPAGDITFVHVLLGTATVIVSVPAHVQLGADDPVWLAFDQNRLHLFDGSTELALTAH